CSFNRTTTTTISTLSYTTLFRSRRESVKFDKITARIEKLCYGLDPRHINPVEVAMKVINGLYDGVTTVELDNLAAEIAATMTTRSEEHTSELQSRENLVCRLLLE